MCRPLGLLLQKIIFECCFYSHRTTRSTHLVPLSLSLFVESLVNPLTVYPNSGFSFVFHLQASSSRSLFGLTLFSKVLFSVSEIWKTESLAVCYCFGFDGSGETVRRDEVLHIGYWD